VASKATTMFGRRNVIIIGGIVFLAGGAINGGSENIPMLILGHVLLGLGVGLYIELKPLFIRDTLVIQVQNIVKYKVECS